MIHRVVLAAALLGITSGRQRRMARRSIPRIASPAIRQAASGTPGLAPPLVSDTLKKAGSVERDYVALVIIHGLSGPIKVKGQLYVSAMPPRADFSDDDVAGLANYVAQDLNGLAADQLQAAGHGRRRPPQKDHSRSSDSARHAVEIRRMRCAAVPSSSSP